MYVIVRLRWSCSTTAAPVLKGVSTPADVDRAVQAGCDGAIISKHCGRQLDGSVSPFEQLP
jgi:isopentenyl diphosphate isomerase/L-lactate dehydrogenase-like FMN-dependent dehydrogenase